MKDWKNHANLAIELKLYGDMLRVDSVVFEEFSKMVPDGIQRELFLNLSKSMNDAFEALINLHEIQKNNLKTSSEATEYVDNEISTRAGLSVLQHIERGNVDLGTNLNSLH